MNGMPPLGSCALPPTPQCPPNFENETTYLSSEVEIIEAGKQFWEQVAGAHAHFFGEQGLLLPKKTQTRTHTHHGSTVVSHTAR